MKKIMLVALAGFMMLAFTQCGGGASGSQEYKDMMSFLKKVEKAFSTAKSCEDLDKATELFWNGVEEKEYAEKDQITEEENRKALEYIQQIDVTYKELLEKFGCE